MIFRCVNFSEMEFFAPLWNGISQMSALKGALEGISRPGYHYVRSSVFGTRGIYDSDMNGVIARLYTHDKNCANSQEKTRGPGGSYAFFGRLLGSLGFWYHVYGVLR